jgi:hypothetical protein
MQITIQAVVKGARGAITKRELCVIDRAGDWSPRSGLGLFIAETHQGIRNSNALFRQPSIYR